MVSSGASAAHDNGGVQKRRLVVTLCIGLTACMALAIVRRDVPNAALRSISGISATPRSGPDGQGTERVAARPRPISLSAAAAPRRVPLTQRRLPRELARREAASPASESGRAIEVEPPAIIIVVVRVLTRRLEPQFHLPHERHIRIDGEAGYRPRRNWLHPSCAPPRWAPRCRPCRVQRTRRGRQCRPARRFAGADNIAARRERATRCRRTLCRRHRPTEDGGHQDRIARIGTVRRRTNAARVR